MKAYFIIFAALITISSYAQPASVDGAWLGTLDVGVQLRVVFNINKTGTTYTATMDSPDQGAKGIPVSSVSIVKDSLHIEIAVAAAKFDGKFINDTAIVGKWFQGNASLPLTLVKMTKPLPSANRPQTPKPPYNYKAEDIEYDNGDKSAHLSATLTFPSTGGPFPAAILISGSGQQDRDETIFDHKPFAVIADYLTKRGFAVLRVDDRGTGKSTGEVKTATSADFAKDVEAGIAFLKSRKNIDTSRIGLIGHSEGGYIASLLAGKREDIDFLVLLGSPGVKGATLLTEQNVAVLQSSGITSDIATGYGSYFSKLTDIVISAKDTSIAQKQAWAMYKLWKEKTPGQHLTMLGFINDEVAMKAVNEQVQALSNPWMKYFLSSDPVKYLEKTKAKVLALTGEKDIQVIPQTNLPGIIKALEKRRNVVHEVKMMQGLNHLFQKCSTCTIDEYAKLEESFSPEALSVIGEWLDKHVKAK